MNRFCNQWATVLAALIVMLALPALPVALAEDAGDWVAVEEEALPEEETSLPEPEGGVAVEEAGDAEADAVAEFDLSGEALFLAEENDVIEL